MIEPALTAEEWKQETSPDDGWGPDRRDEAFTFDADCTVTTSLPIGVRTRQSNNDGSAQWHALAAVSLRGQPFGFTREDVAMLHDLSDSYAWGEAIENLQARIAALLPPEGV